MWCGHHHLSRIGASDISRDPGVCGHGECLQWSDPSPAPFIQILQTSDSHSITQQSQYNSLYLLILFSVRLCVVRLTMLRSAVCHIMPALYSIHLSWPGPLPTCSRVSITLASLIAPPGSAQPCHPPPPPRWHPENNVQCDHTAEEMTPDRCSIVSPNNRGLFVIYWVKFDIPRKGREQRGERESDETQYAVFRARRGSGLIWLLLYHFPHQQITRVGLPAIMNILYRVTKNTKNNSASQPATWTGLRCHCDVINLHESQISVF